MIVSQSETDLEASIWKPVLVVALTRVKVLDPVFSTWSVWSMVFQVTWRWIQLKKTSSLFKHPHIVLLGCWSIFSFKDARSASWNKRNHKRLLKKYKIKKPMRSINLKWLNLTLSNQPDSAIKRLENQDFAQNQNRQLSVAKITIENCCDFRPKQPISGSAHYHQRVVKWYYDLATLNMPNWNWKIVKKR